VRREATAPEAPASSHTDFEKGSSAPETIAYDDYVTRTARRAHATPGKLRLEGKEYAVKDGDVFHSGSTSDKSAGAPASALDSP